MPLVSLPVALHMPYICRLMACTVCVILHCCSGSLQEVAALAADTMMHALHRMLLMLYCNGRIQKWWS
jgi:hypothetical protein